MNLIAKSCFSPGLITLVSNLITSSADYSEDSENLWFEEYIEGMGHEIYRIKLSEKLEKRYFRDIVRIVYKKTKTIAFAIQIRTNHGKTVIRLNPCDFLVNNIQENDIHVYAICPDKAVAESIETIEMTKEEKSRYFVLKEKKSQEDKLLLDGEPEDDMFSSSSDEDAQPVPLFPTLADEADEDEEEEVLSGEVRKEDMYYMEKGGYAHKGDRMTKINLEEDPNIRNHIIVVGMHSSIEDFIMPLRSRQMKEEQLQKIVLVTSQPGSPELGKQHSYLLNQIRKYKEIYRIIGSPLNQETFLRANINFADKVVILGQDPTMKQNLDDEMLDAESIYIYKAIKKCNKEVQIITELVYSSNIDFLMPSLQSNNCSYKLTTLYAAGEVYISSIIDTLTCQAYFNAHIVTILQQLLRGNTEDDDEDVAKFTRAHPDLLQSNL